MHYARGSKMNKRYDRYLPKISWYISEAEFLPWKCSWQLMLSSVVVWSPCLERVLPVDGWGGYPSRWKKEGSSVVARGWVKRKQKFRKQFQRINNFRGCSQWALQWCSKMKLISCCHTTSCSGRRIATSQYLHIQDWKESGWYLCIRPLSYHSRLQLSLDLHQTCYPYFIIIHLASQYCLFVFKVTVTCFQELGLNFHKWPSCSQRIPDSTDLEFLWDKFKSRAHYIFHTWCAGYWPVESYPFWLLRDFCVLPLDCFWVCTSIRVEVPGCSARQCCARWHWQWV